MILSVSDFRRGLGAACLCLPLVLAALSSHAQDFIVEDIHIEGLRRVSPGAVFVELPIGIGERTSPEALRATVRALFDTGNFQDVQISREDNVLIISVVEYPFISDIQISGNEAIKTEDLLEGLQGAGLAAGQVLKRATLEGLRRELQRQYTSRGRYDSTVEATIEEQPRNRVIIFLTIDEGRPARIRSITISGNEAFSDKQLLRVFESRRYNRLFFLSKRGQYSRETLSSDLEKIEAYYRDRSYLRFAVDSVQVSVTPDRRWVNIGIGVVEGESYTLSDVSLAGNLILPEEDLQRFLLLRPELPYSEALATATEEAMVARLGNEGYLNAEVRGVPDIDDEAHRVAMRFFVNPGPRIYVRRIEFQGNERTADTVLRREMRQQESAPASGAKIEQSRIRLERLGYFRNVETETVPVPGNDDLVDLNITVEEEFSGSLGFSLGYSEAYGLLYRLQFERDNLLGTGRSLGLNFQKSRFSTFSSINFVKPYHTPEGVSRSFQVYRRDRDLGRINITRYATTSYGLNLGFSYPLNETDQVSFSLGFSNTEITPGRGAVQEIFASPRLYATDQVPLQYCALTDDNGCEMGMFSQNDNIVQEVVPGFLDTHDDSFDNFLLSLGWNRFRLNRGQLANRGYSHNVGLEVSLLGSDLEYYKLQYRGEYFRPLGRRFTLRLRTRLGYGDGYGGTEVLPFFENFFAGGLGSVRGFDTSSLGPRSTPAERYELVEELSGTASDMSDDFYGVGDCYTQTFLAGLNDECFYVRDGDSLRSRRVFSSDEPEPFGGNVLVTGSAELLVPLPFVPDQRSVRSGFFVDIGNVFSTECRDGQLGCSKVDFGELRYAVGFGLVWITAFGPLSFSVAKPFNTAEYDDEETFEFSVGRGFGL